MDDLDFIKAFSKINITNICRKERVNRSNLLNGNSTKENAKKIRQRIESEVAILYVKADTLQHR